MSDLVLFLLPLCVSLEAVDEVLLHVHQPHLLLRQLLLHTRQLHRRHTHTHATLTRPLLPGLAEHDNRVQHPLYRGTNTPHSQDKQSVMIYQTSSLGSRPCPLLARFSIITYLKHTCIAGKAPRLQVAIVCIAGMAIIIPDFNLPLPLVR